MQPELSRIVHVKNLGLQDHTQTVRANERERAALAERLGVERLDDLSAEITLRLQANGDVALQGRLSGRVTQTCGVTLEPLENEISCSFSVHYRPSEETYWGPEEEELNLSEDDLDAPEPIVDGTIDIGEAIGEQLALEIDPFPRVKGVQFDGYSTGSKTGPETENEAASGKDNPFEVLRKLGSNVKSS